MPYANSVAKGYQQRRIETTRLMKGGQYPDADCILFADMLVLLSESPKCTLAKMCRSLSMNIIVVKKLACGLAKQRQDIRLGQNARGYPTIEIHLSERFYSHDS
jgi:hypothetical protein